HKDLSRAGPTSGIRADLAASRNRVPTGKVVTTASDMVESSLDYAEELARLQRQAFEANATAEKHLSQADLAASRNRVPTGKVVTTAGVSDGPTESSTPVFTPVHTDATSLPPGHSLGSSEHSSRYPSPSDLANSMSSFLEMEDIHYHSDTGIFSSSSYDDDLGGTVTNLAPSIVVDSVVAQALNDPAWIEAMQEEMQQFVNQEVWQLVPLPDGKIAIGTKWILKNKRDARGIVVRNKARLVAQGHRQEEGIDYDEVYVDDIIFGSTNKAWCDEFEVLMKGEFEMSAMGELTFFLGLQVKQEPDGIFINQDKYVQDMLKKFYMESVRPATTPFEASKPKSKDKPDDAVNVHLYRSMICSLMYLTASRPDIQFAVSLWYPRDSPFVLEAYSDSDYAGSHGDRKSTTGGCQFLGRRLISWQCKKQTIVAMLLLLTVVSKSTEAPKSDVPADSQQPSVEVPSQKALIEDVEVPSNTAFTAQPTAFTP
ncbi:ribonuclease H-like domain, reverse transcriptase, RNA-dependent DNA polymerase, partial [Tanacetum coccineum]